MMRVSTFVVAGVYCHVRYMKKKVLGIWCWVLGACSDCLFMLRCVRQDMWVI